MLSRLITVLENDFASRSKTLLRRRKKMTRKRPISNKRLIEQRKVMNYAHEMKILQVQKELDKKKERNNHLHQIMNELFYPDIRLAKKEQLEWELFVKAGRVAEEQIDKGFVSQSIAQSVLATELLAVHTRHQASFTCQNYLHLLAKMSRYFTDLPIIKEERMRHWYETEARLMKANPKKKIPCPYLFLEKGDLAQFDGFIELVKIMREKMLAQDCNQYLRCIEIMSRLLEGTLPLELYQVVLKKNIETGADKMEHQHRVALVKLMGYQKMAVPVLDTPKQKIDDQKSHSPHEFTEEERLKKKFGIELCIQILVSSECSSEDFVTVLRTYRGKYRYFRNNVVCSELKRVLMQYLPELRPEEVIDALDVVCKFKLLFRLPLIELLKFDIYRKITLVRDKRALLLLFTLIEKRKIKDTGIIEAYDLLVVAAETLTKHLHGNQFSSSQITQIFKCFLRNGFKEYTSIDIVSAEFVRQSDKFSLEDLSTNFFRITLLGHRSKALAKCVFQRFSKSYHSLLKQYSKERTQYLPTDKAVPQSQDFSLQEVVLQECLIIVLWCCINQLKEGETINDKYLMTELRLDRLLELLPLRVESDQLLVWELVGNLGNDLAKYKLFTSITYAQKEQQLKVVRLQEFYQESYLKTPLQQHLWKEAIFSGKFVYNYNRTSRKFILERWSRLNVYSLVDYAKWAVNLQTTCCYFDNEITCPQEFIEERIQIAQNYLSTEKTGDVKEVEEAPIRYYNLLD